MKRFLIKDKIISKLVYIPIIGLIFGIVIELFCNYKGSMLQEKYAISWMLFVHVSIPEVLFLIFLFTK